MVTAGTYGKEHFFNTKEKKSVLQSALISTAEQYGWLLQAWAIMANHYHFVAISSDDPLNLRNFVLKLHSATARIINEIDGVPGRKIWFQYWDSRITYQKSYFARLNYVQNNPARHGVVGDPQNYQWCSAAWFARAAEKSFVETVSRFKSDAIKVPDDF